MKPFLLLDLSVVVVVVSALLVPPAHRGPPAPRRGIARRAGGEEEDDVLMDSSSLRDAFRARAAAKVEESKAAVRAEREAARYRGRPVRGELGMRDRRVQAAQEPQNELRELTENGDNWGLLALPGLLLRFGAVFAFAAGVAALFVDNYDTYNELVDLAFSKRAALSALVGATFSLGSAARLLAQWNYVASRLSDKTLYFEETGWADGFRLQKPDNTAFRDQLLYDDEVAPRKATVQLAFALVLAAALLSLAAFVLVWIP